MEDLEKEIQALETYLKTCIKKEFLVEAIWLAFHYKTLNPRWSSTKCMEAAIWDWLLYSDGKRESLSPSEAIKKINDLKNKKTDSAP
jgi:hypothetical protein